MLKLYPYTDADIQAQQQAVAQAQANLQTKLQPATEPDIEAQRQAVIQAQQSLAEKETPYLPADIAAAKATVAQSLANLQTALTNLEGGSIVAPYDGLIGAVNVNVNENSRSGVTSGGTSGGSGSSSNGITIINPSSLIIYVQVDESDIAQVAPGQSATLTFDGLPGKRFTGKVVSVSPTSTTTQGVVGYQVGIQLQNTDGVAQGMTTTAQIITAERQNVLMVPNRALTQVQGQARATQGQGGSGGQNQNQGQAAQRPQGQGAQFQGGQGAQARQQQAVQRRQVQIQTENGPETRIVEIGIANDTSTEILSGLEEGDVILLPSTTARASVPGAAGARPGAGGPVFLGGGAAPGR